METNELFLQEKLFLRHTSLQKAKASKTVFLVRVAAANTYSTNRSIIY